MLLQLIGQHAMQAAHAAGDTAVRAMAVAADTTSDVVADPRFRGAEDTTRLVFSWLRLGVETIGALVIAAGVVVGVIQFLRTSFLRQPDGYTDVRLRLSRFLAVALEFQLGADLLSTAIAPSWNTIRNLAAIAIIRTGLNYFLGREMTEEAKRLTEAGESREAAAQRATGAKPTGGTMAGMTDGRQRG